MPKHLGNRVNRDALLNHTGAKASSHTMERFTVTNNMNQSCFFLVFPKKTGNGNPIMISAKWSAVPNENMAVISLGPCLQYIIRYRSKNSMRNWKR